MKAPYWLHKLTHWHRSFTKETIPNTIIDICVPRIWWDPRRINVEKIRVWMVSDDLPHIYYGAFRGQEDFDRLLSCKSPAEMKMTIFAIGDGTFY